MSDGESEAMARRLEPTDRGVLVARGGELGRGYEAEVLIAALARRLDRGGFGGLGRLITRSLENEDRGSSTRAVFFAIALIGRFRAVGRARGDGIFVAMGRESRERARVRGEDAKVIATEANAWTYLRSTLVRRLQADGHEDLAGAISAAFSACWAFRDERGRRRCINPHGGASSFFALRTCLDPLFP